MGPATKDVDELEAELMGRLDITALVVVVAGTVLPAVEGVAGRTTEEVEEVFEEDTMIVVGTVAPAIGGEAEEVGRVEVDEVGLLEADDCEVVEEVDRLRVSVCKRSS